MAYLFDAGLLPRLQAVPKGMLVAATASISLYACHPRPVNAYADGRAGTPDAPSRPPTPGRGTGSTTLLSLRSCLAAAARGCPRPSPVRSRRPTLQTGP